MRRALVSMLAVAGAVAVAAGQAPASGVDAAFDAFFKARTPSEVAAASSAIAASGVGFDAAYSRLKRGRTYSADVPRGIVQGSYRDDSGEYFYTLDVPATYDPAHAYQARVQLHGGVGRIATNTPSRTDAAARLAGAEQIYILPYAWRDAPWWTRRQTNALRGIVDQVKRTYNVDENHVALSGVSDGGTGAYFIGMRDTTPYASILPLNGFFMVLRNEMMEAEGDLFPNNLLNKPLFVVNGGRDPLYPASVVTPYVEQLQTGGAQVVYKPQANAAHDTSWWPEIKDTFERFVTEHPRTPLPDNLTWETGNVPDRAHWLVIDRLAPASAGEATLPDLNRRVSAPVEDFGIRGSGTRINRVIERSNAQQFGLKSGDVVAAVNNQPTSEGTDVVEVLRGFPPGRPLILNIVRGDQTVRLTGRLAPTVLDGEAAYMFPPSRPSGRVDLKKSGNRVEAATHGVAAFTLLISPDQFDFGRPLTVVVNGRTAFEGAVNKELTTLLRWAARDNDRTMLFGATVSIEVQ